MWRERKLSMSLFDVSRPKIEKKAEKKMIGLERGTETDTESRRSGQTQQTVFRNVFR